MSFVNQNSLQESTALPFKRQKARTGVSAMQKKFWFLPLVVLGLILNFGCSKSSPPDDARIVTDVQSRFFADPNVQSKQIAVVSKDGAVTLTGRVASDRERMAAAEDAVRAAGVKTVINDLQVSVPEQSQAQPDNEQAVAKPSAAQAKPRAKRVNTSWYNQSPPAPWPYPPAPAASPFSAENTTSAAAATPAVPEPRRVTIPAGTAVTVRLIDPIDSAVNRVGEAFHATLDSPLVQDGDVIVPTGYEVEGHLTEAQSAGRLSGHSQLGLTLDRLIVQDKYYDLRTTDEVRMGPSRGKATAIAVGTGAGIGAIIGGLAGGGRGAAIGATIGGAGTTGIEATQRGPQIILPPESMLTFRLAAPITVIATSQTGPNPQRPRLHVERVRPRYPYCGGGPFRCQEPLVAHWR